jgi:hypothetical protein
MAILQLKRGTSARWSELNPILAAGEPGFITDKNIFKIGDGITPFNELEAIGNTDLSTIALRRDNDYNYKKIENTFIPANGEVCLVDVAGYGLRSKVGDGFSTFAQLPYTDEAILQNINSLIVKGFFYQGKFYSDANHTELIESVMGRIYIDAISSKLYTYNGINYETQAGSLPNATAETAGAVKLYDQLGQNIDGTMTQRAITNELNEKFEMDVVEEEEMVVFDVDID